MDYKHILSFLILHLFSVSIVQALQADKSLTTFRVGVKEAPPFVIKEGDAWRGISIELWKKIARELEIEYEFVSYDLQELVQKTEDGEVDIAVAALTINAPREKRIDFTHAYYSTGLGIAALSEAGGFMGILRNLFSLTFLKAIGGLAFLLLFFGFIIWVLERRQNPQFGGKPLKGIGSGFWWSAVTMTTVGYGDKAPVTAAGRILALIWMFMALIVISGFTAAIASALTVTQLESSIDSPNDLYNFRVVTVENSSSADFLASRNIRYRSVNTVDSALTLLANRKTDAVVYDIPIMQYLLMQRDDQEIKVLPQSFQNLYYGFALPESSTLKEEIDVKMLEIIARPEWRRLREDYLGEAY